MLQHAQNCPLEESQKSIQNSKKSFQMSSKFMPGDHLRAQKQAMVAWEQQKIKFSRLGTSKMHAKRDPNGTSRRHQNESK